MNEKTHPKQLRTLLHVCYSLHSHHCLFLTLSLVCFLPPLPSLSVSVPPQSHFIVNFQSGGLYSDHHVLSISSASGTDGVRRLWNPSGIFRKVSTAL